jgi:transposase
MDLRKRVVAACQRRSKTREVLAEEFGVSTSWIRRLLQRRRETGSIAPLPQNPGRKPKFDEKQLRRLGRIVERRPDATLRELKERMGVTVSDGTMIRALHKLKLSLKKSQFMRQSRSART